MKPAREFGKRAPAQPSESLTSDELRGMEPGPEVGLGSMIAGVRRELALQESAYPRFVEQRRMRRAEAIRHYVAMKAVLRLLKRLEAEQDATAANQEGE